VSLMPMTFGSTTAARLGKRAAVVDPKVIGMSDTVAVMTGAMSAGELAGAALA